MDAISRIFEPKNARDKAVRAVIERSAQSLPIVKTVQAIHSFLEVGSNVSRLVSRVSEAAEETQKFIPEIQVMVHSLCDNAKTLGYFSTTATTVGIGINLVQTYQGIQALQLIAAKLEGISTQLAAQTALIAQKEFPQYVYDMIGERLNQTLDDPICDHWFFLYHPDNDWYPKFYHLLEKKPLGQRFCGYTNQIDTIFIFMQAARRQVERKNLRAQEKGRQFRNVKIHLLMPAYQPVLVAEALKIPEEIGDFVIEGRINSNKPFVWLNLPEEQRRYVMDIGHWVPPSLGWLDWAMSKVGMANGALVLREPRVLGTRQRQDNGDYKSECEGSDGGEVDERNEEAGDDTASPETVSSQTKSPPTENTRRHATPIHHRRRGDRGKSQRKESRGAKERTQGSASSTTNPPYEQAPKKGSKDQKVTASADNPWLD
ncbi:hypothetical protein BGZ63DRAFT_386696 [Mariannaea sp. PMI_226]|nr:hypothetical protein BGZ63DRAFT_386696 [Mariannaea sp. PMI_226]